MQSRSLDDWWKIRGYFNSDGLLTSGISEWCKHSVLKKNVVDVLGALCSNPQIIYMAYLVISNN